MRVSTNLYFSNEVGLQLVNLPELFIPLWNSESANQQVKEDKRSGRFSQSRSVLPCTQEGMTGTAALAAKQDLHTQDRGELFPSFMTRERIWKEQYF